MDLSSLIKNALKVITGKNDPIGEPKQPDVNNNKVMALLANRRFAEQNKQGQTPSSQYPLPTTTPYPSPTPIPGAGSPYMNADTNNFIEKVVIPMSKRYGLDPGIAAGQFANEGRLGGVGAKVNNFFNVGVTDAMVAEAQKTNDWSKIPAYDSPEAGVERYMQFISGKLPTDRYANGEDGSAMGKLGRKQFEEIYNKYKDKPEEFLTRIGPTYASTGKAYAQRTMDTPEYQKYVINKALSLAQTK